MATGVGQKKMQLTAFDGAFLKIPYRRNFFAMATEVGRRKMQLSAFDGAFPINLL